MSKSEYIPSWLKGVGIVAAIVAGGGGTIVTASNLDKLKTELTQQIAEAKAQTVAAKQETSALKDQFIELKTKYTIENAALTDQVRALRVSTDADTQRTKIREEIRSMVQEASLKK